MAKRKAEWENKSRFKHARSVFAVGIVLVLAAALILTGVLMTVLDRGDGVATVSAINLESEKIGMTADLNNVFVRILYSDGSSRNVALSELMPEGLDLTYAGKQTVTINYGNQQWSLPVEVVSSKIKIEYVTSDGGYIEGDAYQEIPAGESGATVRAVPNEGYYFDGWDDGVLSETRNERSVSQNRTVRALFKRNAYTVAFQRADGRWDEQTVLYGDPAVPPDSHTWKMRNYGYKFVQWDSSVADSLESVTRNLLVRGEYEQYHSKFSVSVTGNPDNVKDRTVSAANHTFGSDVQTEDKNSTVSYLLDGKSYTRRANVYTGFYEWEAVPSSVIAVNAAQDSVLDCWLVRMKSGGWQKIEVGGSAKVLLPGSGGDESDMSEFSAAAAENGVYKLTFTLNPLQDKDAVLEVVAVMEYERNDILFYNRSDHVKTVSLPYASTLTEADFPVLEMTGFDFDGWTIRNSNTKVTTETYFKETTVVDAQWTPKRYTVSFTIPEEWRDMGCSFEETEFTKEYNSTLGGNFPPNSPACDGYDFAGWFVEGISGGSAVTEATVVYGDMVLVPSFTPKRHTVRFEITGGNGRVYAVKDGGNRETVGSGTYVIEEPSSYVFSVEWDTEYVFASLSVDGTGVAPVLTGNSFTLNFNKNGSDGAYGTDKGRTVSIKLVNSVFGLSFTNGSGNVSGTVTVSGDYGGTFDGENITLDVPMHAQVLYTVAAPKGYVIDSVTVDGTAVDISANASEYTGLMGDVLEPHAVEITYKERTFAVKIKDGGTETTGTVKSESPFEYEITAPAGSYAAKVTLNGRSVDLYRFEAASSSGYYIDEDTFKVNLRAPTAGEIERRDARVTNAKVKIDGVAEDADIVIEYADLEYTLTFRGEGYGTVLSDASVNVGRNQGWAVVLTTETGYYIAGYRASSNGVTTTVSYNSFASDYTEEITNVTEDADYVFIFARRTFSVIFGVSGGDLNVSSGGETTVLSGSALKDYGVDYGSSVRFTLSVAADRRIEKVRLLSDGGVEEALETGTVESSYELVLDKITDGYRVIVTVSEKPTVKGDGVLVIEKTTGGKVTAPMGDSYASGEELVLTVIPESGYEIRSVVVSSAGRFSRAITAQSVVNGKFTVSSADTASAAGAEIKVSPVFAPKNFNVTLEIGGSEGGRYDGQGRIAVGPEKDSAADKVTVVGETSTESVAYGSNYYVYFIAGADSVISEIKVDGVHLELNSSNLEDYTMTAPDGGYASARISVRVSGETTVSAVFRKETFNVTVANSYNGTTEIVNASGGFLKGEDVLIGMTADDGYHITGLYVDGIKIEESNYLNFGGDDAKLNTAAKYTYANISKNITVVAQYEMNYYSLGFTAVNLSKNFAEVNTAFGSYGSVTLDYKNGGIPTVISETDGRAEYNATFANIAHGTTVELNVRAAYASGYYIRNLTVQMLSGGTSYTLISDGQFAGYDENLPCYATGNVYTATVGIRGAGGITADVYSVYVEFTRTEYKVSAIYGAGADAATGSPLTVSFVNSYNNGQTAKVEELTDVSGRYYLVEFGIQATVMVTPPSERLRLTSLVDQISEYDYTYNVIGNRYTGLISRNVSFIASYEVRQMNITLTVDGEDYGSANIDGFSGSTATLPYGSELRFILIPETAKGGIIDALSVNGGTVSLISENGVYYYVIEELTTDIDAQAFFELEKFSATQSVNVTAGGSVSLTDGAGNRLNNNEIPWGDDLNATITVNRAYNLVSVKVNGEDYHIDDLVYEELNGIRRYSMEIRNVREDYAITVGFELKTFGWEAPLTPENAARGSVYIADPDGKRLDKLTANGDVYLYVKPKSGFVVTAVSGRMQSFDGIYGSLTLDAEYFNPSNLDERRYLIENVSGIISANVEFGYKEFTVKIASVIGYDGFERMSLTVRRGGVITGDIALDRWSSSVVTGVRFGDEVELVVKAREGYDIMGISVNGKEYLAGNNTIYYYVAYDEYHWNVAVDDDLVNNLDEYGNHVIGGNSSYELKYTMASERDSFVVKLSGNYEGIADVSVSDRMSYGSRNSIIITAHEGYSITSVKISSPKEYASGEYDMLPYYAERVSELRFDLVVDASCGVFQYQDTGVMDKFIIIEINAEINSYNQSVKEYVHDNETVTTDVSQSDAMVASHTTAYYINKEGTPIDLNYETSVEHFLEVTVETNPLKPQEYEFWGFQEYIAGRGWVGEIENITYAGGSANKFTYISDRARSFRAVYVRRYTVEVEIVPFHKYLSGSYIPETGTFMGYATYGAIGAAVTDPFGLGTSNAANVSSTNAKYVYEVAFGDVLSITATDSNTQNRSRSVNYYAENGDGALELISSGSMGMSLSVKKDMKIYAAYDNNIQFAMTTESVGGEKAGEGATVEYSVGGSLRVMQNNSFAVNAFDKVTVRVTLDENYRFDGLLSLEAQNRGDLGTLIWTSTWDTLFDFEADGEKAVVRDRYDDNVSGTQSADGKVLTFEFTVTENAIYKLVLHRMFRIEISENDGYDDEGNPVTVENGARLGETVTNNRAPAGWYDYGATVTLTSEPVEDSQFVGWFINGTNYFDLSATLAWNNVAAEEHAFTLSGDRVSGAVDLDIRAEYLPIYTLNIYRGLEYEGGTKFYGSTNLTSVNAVKYGGGSVSITMGAACEAAESFGVAGNSMEALSHVVSFADKDNLSKASNKITLTVRPNASFVFSDWSVNVGNPNNEADWKHIDGSNSTEFVFDLVKYLYDNGYTVNGEQRNVHFRANITKNNVIRVSKVVYYDAFGVISPSNGLADNRAYVGTQNTQTVSTVEYGTEVTVSVQAGQDYRFLGWYDITGTGNSITEIGADIKAIPDAGTSYTLRLQKGAAPDGSTDPVEGYTYYLEARFMREVTVTFAVENNSANGNDSFKYQVPVIKGTKKALINYAGNTVETKDTSDIDTSTASAPSLRHTVTMKADAGTYVAFELPTDISKDGFSYDNHKYLGLSSGSYVERGENGEYYVVFDRNRTITVLYGAYGTINLQDILPHATVKFGEVFTNLYLDQNRDASGNPITVNNGTYSLTVSGSELTVVNKTAQSITVPLPNMPKVDYQTDLNSSAAASYEQVRVFVNPMSVDGAPLSYEISVGFSYKSEESMTLDYSLVDFGQMPFASGAGTASNPYIVSNLEQLRNVGRVYELSGNTLGSTYRYFAMETKMRNGSPIPETQKFMYLNGDGKDWTPLCRNGGGFDGVFDFKEWEIGGLTGNVTDNYFGVFARLNNATIRSFNFGGKNNVTGTADYVGLITGYAINTTFEDINVKDNQTRILDGNTTVGTIGTTGNYLGLVAGYAESCTINSGIYIYSAKISGGGDVSYELGDTIYRNGLYVGAMFGRLKNTNVGTTSADMVLAINNVTVDGHRYIGGVAGYFEGQATVKGVTLLSGTFGTQNVSGDVGGLLGYVVGNATVTKVSAPQTSDSNSVTVYGIYRSISSVDIENNNIEPYLYNRGEFGNALGSSNIGGLIGRLDGTLDGAEIGGSMQIYGSVAGGMVGFNRGTVKNLKIHKSGRVIFVLKYGGVYGGMVGYNEGLVNYATIGSVNTFKGLTADMGRVINYESSDMSGEANVIFKTEGSASGVQGSGSSSIYSPASGTLYEEWGGLAMGGMVGYNVSRVYNSVTYGKIVHYKKVYGGSYMLDALGGVVGMNRGNSAEVRACGTSYGIVLGYTVINVSNQMQTSHSVAAGGVIGSHSGGIAIALFSFHSAVSTFTNAGVPGDGYVAPVVRVSAGAGGLLAAVPGTATAQSFISWGYYTSTSFNGDYFGAIVLGSQSAVSSQTLGASATNINAQNISGIETDNRFTNVMDFTNYNYNTYVNSTTGHVYNVKAKDANLGDFRYAAAEDRTRAGYRVRDYFNEYAKVYAVNDEGRPTSTLVPWQYDG